MFLFLLASGENVSLNPKGIEMLIFLKSFKYCPFNIRTDSVIFFLNQVLKNHSIYISP